MSIRFSIVVPVYNGERFIDDLLKNLLSSNYDNYEVVLIDDGSTDQSLNCLSKYAEEDARVKVFHKENGGIWAARNFGLENSTGDYILFSDQDDKLFVEQLDLLNNDIIANNYPDIVCEQAEWVDEKTHDRIDSETVFTGKVVNQLIGHDEIIKHLCLPMISELRQFAGEPYLTSTNTIWNLAYKKEFLSANNIRFIQGMAYDDDYFFNVTVFSRAQTAYLSDRFLYRWYVRSASESHTIKYIQNYSAKADAVCQYEMNELIRYIIKNSSIELTEAEITQIACDKYWYRIKEALRNECLQVNTSSQHEKVNHLKELDLSKTNSQSIAKDSFINKIRYYMLKFKAYRLLILLKGLSFA